MKTITPLALQNLLTVDSGLAVIDVRTPGEFSRAHVPQAHNISLDQIDPQALLSAGRIHKKDPVYLLCQSGGRATRAAEKFYQAGVENAVVVQGGTIAWADAGLPVVKGNSGVISLERQVRIAAGSLVLLGVVLAVMVHPYFIGISAFVGAGLIFAGITDWCGMGLLLAKLPWNK